MMFRGGISYVFCLRWTFSCSACVQIHSRLRKNLPIPAVYGRFEHLMRISQKEIFTFIAITLIVFKTVVEVHEVLVGQAQPLEQPCRRRDGTSESLPAQSIEMNNNLSGS